MTDAVEAALADGEHVVHPNVERIRRATVRFPHRTRTVRLPGAGVGGGVISQPDCRALDGSALRVVQRRCNFSAFNGYHYTPSDWSYVRCEPEHGGCGSGTRTKAAYVDLLADAQP